MLLTFIGFFVFISNMGRLPVFYEFPQGAVSGHELLTSVAASQIISNVPAALLLFGFTDSLPLLIIGVNIGGLGTPIASMASLISYKFAAREEPGKRGAYFRQLNGPASAFSGPAGVRADFGMTFPLPDPASYRWISAILTGRFLNRLANPSSRAMMRPQNFISGDTIEIHAEISNEQIKKAIVICSAQILKSWRGSRHRQRDTYHALTAAQSRLSPLVIIIPQRIA